MSIENVTDFYNVFHHKDKNKDLQHHYVLDLNPDIHTENQKIVRPDWMGEGS